MRLYITNMFRAIRWLVLLWVAIVIVGLYLVGAPLWGALAVGLWVLYKEQ
jgi:hypothetical protein